METSLIFALIKGIIMPALAIFLLGKLNIFDIISVIPKDKKFEIGLAAYLGILECIYVRLRALIISNKAQIECVFWSAGQARNINSTPEIVFNDEVAYINVKINVCGNRNRLIHNELILPFPTWVQVQIDNVNNIRVDKSTCTLDIGKIINGNNKIVEDTYYQFKIGLIKNYSKEDGYGTTVRPELRKKFMRKFNHNKVKIN